MQDAILIYHQFHLVNEQIAAGWKGQFLFYWGWATLVSAFYIIWVILNHIGNQPEMSL